MRLAYRILIILGIYLILVLFGIIAEHKIENQISPEVFANPSISVQTFLDDFISIKISCYGNKKEINFLVQDEYENFWYNSTVLLNCDGYKEIDLQGSPQDYPLDRKYRVIANFDNQSIKSGYFNFEEDSRFGLIKKEVFSFFSFAMYDNRLARGSYTDSQRMLYLATGDSVYGKNYLLSHLTGFIFTLSILLSIDIAIWIIYFIYMGFKKFKLHKRKGFFNTFLQLD
jgi:hypothetical protein